MKNINELDLLDKKILYELDRNSRQSASEISNKVRAHRNVVNFRINKLIERGIIKEFVTIISPSALGLTPYKFYFQFENFTKEKEQKILGIIKSLPVYWAAKVSGRWDFIAGFLIKNTTELNDIKLKILEELGEDISNKSISVLVEAPYFYRHYLLDKKKNKTMKYWIKNSGENKVDKKDLELLKILAKNSRESLLNLSIKLNLSVKTIINRMKNLERLGIITDYRISVDLEKINYKFFKCFIALKTTNKKEIQRFIEYCNLNNNIIHLIECVGDWDLEPEFEVESSEDFYKIISEIREKFQGIIKTIETIDIIKEYTYVCLPDYPLENNSN